MVKLSHFCKFSKTKPHEHLKTPQGPLPPFQKGLIQWWVLRLKFYQLQDVSTSTYRISFSLCKNIILWKLGKFEQLSTRGLLLSSVPLPTFPPPPHLPQTTTISAIIISVYTYMFKVYISCVRFYAKFISGHN